MTNQKWAFTCPRCGSHDINIEACMSLGVRQFPETGEFETYPNDDAEWYYDNDSYTYCQNCDYDGKLKEF